MGRKDMSETTASTAVRPPKVIIFAGRGNVGKSTTCAFLLETGKFRYPVRALDASNNNRLFERMGGVGVERAEGGEDDVMQWIEGVIAECAEKAGTPGQFDVLIDTNGETRILSRWGHELKFVNMIEESGLEPVLIYMVGTDVKDVDFIEEHEALTESGDRVFAPRCTAVIRNGGKISGTGLAKLHFKAVNERLKQVFQRPVLVTDMQGLACMNLLMEQHIGFKDGRMPSAVVNMFQAGRVKAWTTAGMRSTLTVKRAGSDDCLAAWLDVTLDGVNDQAAA